MLRVPGEEGAEGGFGLRVPLADPRDVRDRDLRVRVVGAQRERLLERGDGALDRSLRRPVRRDGLDDHLRAPVVPLGIGRAPRDVGLGHRRPELQVAHAREPRQEDEELRIARDGADPFGDERASPLRVVLLARPHHHAHERVTRDAGVELRRRLRGAEAIRQRPREELELRSGREPRDEIAPDRR